MRIRNFVSLMFVYICALSISSVALAQQDDKATEKTQPAKTTPAKVTSEKSERPVRRVNRTTEVKADASKATQERARPEATKPFTPSQARPETSNTSTPSQSRSAQMVDAWVNKIGLFSDYAVNQPAIGVVFVESISDDMVPTFLKLDKSEFDALGAFTYIDSTSAELNYKLNKRGLDHKFANPEEVLTHILKTTLAGLLIHTPKGKSWEIYNLSSNGQLAKLKTTRPVRTSTTRIMHRWLVAQLGFTGVVLAVEEDRVLVTAAASFLKTRGQAIVIADSKDKFTFEKEVKEGVALIQYANRSNSNAIFNVVVRKEPREEILPGMKTRMGKELL